ncbi:MAG: Gfo/Idh/MocA family oxidoreductase [Planctomycetota bacterium]
MAKTFKIGMMGAGVVADYGHLPAIRYIPGIECHALFDPKAQRVETMRANHHVPNGFTDVDAFFASGLDAVAICSPAPTHRANVELAAKHGLPILCEKPLSMDKAEGRAMIDACQTAGVPLVVGFCYRFAQPAKTIKTLVDQGAIGDVRTLRLIYNWDCHGLYYRPDPRGRPGHWAIDPRRQGRMHEGGPLVDCGVHQIDLALWWTGGDVVRSQGHGAWVDEYDAPDHVFFHMDLDTGAHVLVEMSFSYGHTTRDKFSEFVYELIGTDGMIRYDRNESFFELRTHQETRRLEFDSEKNFAEMYRDFERLLRTGDAGDLCTAEQAERVTDLARTATDRVIADRALSPRRTSAKTPASGIPTATSGATAISTTPQAGPL